MTINQIFIMWVFFQLGNLLSIFLGTKIETAILNLFFSGGFMIALILKIWLTKHDPKES